MFKLLLKITMMFRYILPEMYSCFLCIYSSKNEQYGATCSTVKTDRELHLFLWFGYLSSQIASQWSNRTCVAAHHCHMQVHSVPFSSAFSMRAVGMFYPPFSGVLLGPIPVLWAKARVHHGWVTSSSQDPYWWQRLTHKVPTAHQESFWGSLSCSRILQRVAQFHPRRAGSPPALPTELQPPQGRYVHPMDMLAGKITESM